MTDLLILNNMSFESASQSFFACCASRQFANRMCLSRPFQSREHLFQVAKEIWFSLPSSEWRIAFEAHPKYNFPL